MKTIVISGFPGIGKTYFYNNTKLLILDSDSSTFDKKYFPQNYIDHITNNLGKFKIILVSSHKEVRDALVENNISFIVVYPSGNLKEEYLDRYKMRNSSSGFIKLLSENWDGWINDISKQNSCDSKIILSSNYYLSDLFVEHS